MGDDFMKADKKEKEFLSFLELLKQSLENQLCQKCKAGSYLKLKVDRKTVLTWTPSYTMRVCSNPSQITKK